MSNIVVLSGGISNEREVSLRSGRAVAQALRKNGHTVTVIDPSAGLRGIGKPDVVFPALHGLGGEDGTIQAALETAGLPYVGSGVAASALCFDKWLYRQVLEAAGLPVAKGALVTVGTFGVAPLAQKPFVLKPIQGGSTLDTFIVRDPYNADHSKLTACIEKYGVMLLEELVPGIELTVGALGDQVLPAVEIIPPENGEFDYENKYNGKTRELCPPKHIDDALHLRTQKLALEVHTLTGCRDLSRTDIMVTPAGELIILETNTMPGMTEQSLFPKAAATSGITMPELIEQLVQLALRR